MAAEQGAYVPKDISEVLRLVQTASRAKEAVQQASADQNQRFKAGETHTTYRVTPEKGVLVARFHVRGSGNNSQRGEEASGVSYESTGKTREVTGDAPFIAASWAVNIWGGEEELAFWDNPMHEDSQGLLPRSAWQLNVGTGMPGIAKVEELDLSGLVRNTSLIGQGVQLDLI